MADMFKLFYTFYVSYNIYDKNISILRQYMSANNLPDDLKEKILNYYKLEFQMRHFNESEIINTLSKNLRRELLLTTAGNFIEKVEAFKSLSISTLGNLVAAMKSVVYSTRDVIIELGSEPDDISFISTGSVAIIDKNGTELCRLKDGDEFGTICFVGTSQNYTVVALETTEIFAIDRKQLMKYLQSYPEVIEQIFQSAEDRLAKFKILEDGVTEAVEQLF